MGMKNESIDVFISEGSFDDLRSNYLLLATVDEENPFLGRVKKIVDGAIIRYWDPSTDQKVNLWSAGKNHSIDSEYQRSVNEYNQTLQKQIQDVLSPFDHSHSSQDASSSYEESQAVKSICDKFCNR